MWGNMWYVSGTGSRTDEGGTMTNNDGFLVKFKDVTTSAYETTFGTCDYCFSTGRAIEPTFYFNIFADEDSEIIDSISVDGWYWSWGWLTTMDVDNFVKFAEWFDEQNIRVDNYTLINYDQLSDWVDDYNAAMGNNW